MNVRSETTISAVSTARPAARSVAALTASRTCSSVPSRMTSDSAASTASRTRRRRSAPGVSAGGVSLDAVSAAAVSSAPARSSTASDDAQLVATAGCADVWGVAAISSFRATSCSSETAREEDMGESSRFQVQGSRSSAAKFSGFTIPTLNFEP